MHVEDPPQPLVQPCRSLGPDRPPQLPVMRACQRAQRGIGRAALPGQRQYLRPPILGRRRAGQHSFRLQGCHRPADLGLLDMAAGADIPRRHIPELPQMRQHPPLRPGHAIAITIHRLKRARGGFGRLVQKIGQKALKVEIVSPLCHFGITLSGCAAAKAGRASQASAIALMRGKGSSDTFQRSAL